MKRLLYILLFSFVPLCLFSQTINVDTLLLIDSNAVAKGKLYYLRFSNDTLFINSDTVVSGGGDSFWYASGTDTITTDNHVRLDSSFVSFWNGGYFGNDGTLSGFDTSAYVYTLNLGDNKAAYLLSAFQSGVPTVQMTAYHGDAGSQVYLEPEYMLIASDSLLFCGLLEGEAVYLLGQDVYGQTVLTENTGGDSYWTWVDAATDTLYNNQPPEGTGVIFLKTDVFTDRWLKQASNTVFGIGAMGSDNLTHSAGPEGYYNTALGYQALYSITTGYINTAIGNKSLYSHKSGKNNIAIGSYSLYYDTIGLSNIAIGSSSMYENRHGDENVAVGASTLRSNTIGNWNVALGNEALYDNTQGVGNVAIGRKSLDNNTIGDYNVAIGVDAGYTLDTGNYNIFLGFDAGWLETGSNKLYIENSNSATPLIYGDFAEDSIRINGSCDITDFLKLVPQANPPLPATAGMIYSDTDGHLYHYDGSNWDQLDN